MRCDTQGPEELGVWKPRAGIPAKSEHRHCVKFVKSPQQNICVGPFVRQYSCKEQGALGVDLGDAKRSIADGK